MGSGEGTGIVYGVGNSGKGERKGLDSRSGLELVNTRFSETETELTRWSQLRLDMVR